MALHFMDLSQAEPFDGSAGSSERFSNFLEASSRILSLKFGHNRATNSWDITDIEFGVDG